MWFLDGYFLKSRSPIGSPFPTAILNLPAEDEQGYVESALGKVLTVTSKTVEIRGQKHPGYLVEYQKKANPVSDDQLWLRGSMKNRYTGNRNKFKLHKSGTFTLTNKSRYVAALCYQIVWCQSHFKWHLCYLQHSTALCNTHGVRLGELLHFN